MKSVSFICVCPGADSGYRGELIEWVEETFDCVLEVIKKEKEARFSRAMRRWVVERTFAWLGRYRRLSKDYEKEPSSSEAMVYLASIRLMLRHLSDPDLQAQTA